MVRCLRVSNVKVRKSIGDRYEALLRKSGTALASIRSQVRTTWKWTSNGLALADPGPRIYCIRTPILGTFSDCAPVF